MCQKLLKGNTSLLATSFLCSAGATHHAERTVELRSILKKCPFGHFSFCTPSFLGGVLIYWDKASPLRSSPLSRSSNYNFATPCFKTKAGGFLMSSSKNALSIFPQHAINTSVFCNFVNFLQAKTLQT